MSFSVQTIKPGNGKKPKSGNVVSVHYIGTLEDGTKFDSSRDRGQVFKFGLGKKQVIRGWEEGVAQMSEGERAKITCPPNYAYGADGIEGVIPQNSTLIFDVELISFK